MLCCNADNCDIQYSRAALTNLGFKHVADSLSYLTCHDTELRPALSAATPPATKTKDKKPDVSVITAVVSVSGVILICALFTFCLVRSRHNSLGSDTTGCRLPFTRVCSTLPASPVLLLVSCSVGVCVLYDCEINEDNFSKTLVWVICCCCTCLRDLVMEVAHRDLTMNVVPISHPQTSKERVLDRVL
jgi:hypothetical protein